MTPAVIVLLDMHASHETITDQIVMTCTCYRHYASAQCSAHMFKLQSPVFDARDLMRSSLSQYAPCADRSLVKRRYCKNVTDERTDDRRQTGGPRQNITSSLTLTPRPLQQRSFSIPLQSFDIGAHVHVSRKIYEPRPRFTTTSKMTIKELGCTQTD